MKIKSNSHAREIIRELMKQGYLKSWWKYEDLPDGRTRGTRQYYFVNKNK